jgi:hypothetical protein
MEEDDDSVQFITVEEFTEDQWDEIRVIANAIQKTGAFQKDAFRCAIKAVILWLANKDELAVGIPEGEAHSLDRKAGLH